MSDARVPLRKRRAPVLRPRSPAFWFFAVVLLVATVYAVGEQTAFHRISPGGWLLSWLLLAVYALPVFAAVYLLDLHEREPMSLLVASLLWGAVGATTLAAIGNAGWGGVVARLAAPEFAARWTAALTAPVVEEIVKVAGVALLALIAADEFDDVLDGFVYGAMCGLGFAVVEDVFYFVGVFGGSPSAVLGGFYVRVVSGGLYGHVLYTGVAGMGVALVAGRRGTESTRTRWAGAAALLGLAVGAHFLWNSPLLDLFPSHVRSGTDVLRIPLAAALKGAPLLAFVVVAVALARRREGRWLADAFWSEAGSEGVTTTEAGILTDARARRRSRRAMRSRAGPAAARLLARLQREQVNLAMLRSRAPADDPDVVRQRAYCRSLRDALLAIPGAGPAAGPSDTSPPASAGGG